MEFKQLAEAVMKHATEHYNDGGWDVIVETMTIDEIVEELQQGDYDEHGNLHPIETVEQAVASYRDGVVSVWKERQDIAAACRRGEW